MADNLIIPPVIYDFTLFHECSNSDFTSSNAKRKIKGDGSLMNFIKWDAKGTTSQTYDAGGKTKFGVTENIAWKEFGAVNGNNSIAIPSDKVINEILIVVYGIFNNSNLDI